MDSRVEEQRRKFMLEEVEKRFSERLKPIKEDIKKILNILEEVRK